MSGDERPLRIVFVLPEYLPVIGGTQVHTHEVARRLVAGGHEVTVVAACRSPELQTREVIQGVNVVRVPARPRRRDYYFSPAVVRTVRALAPDIVHCQGYHTFVAPLAMLAARGMRVPYVVTFHSGGHSSWVRRRMRPVQWWLIRPLVARAERVIAVSQFEADLIRAALRLPPDLVTVIPNGADISRPAANGVEPDPDLIVSIGRVERFKGHHRVVQALPHIVEARSGAHLRILGAGPFEAKLRALSRRLGVEDRVEIAGVPPNERGELVRVLERAAVVVSLSQYEASGIGAWETIFLGRPLLLRDSTAYGLLVSAGLARGVAPGESTGGIARAILEQLERPSTPPTVDLPTWDACTSQLLALYRSIVTRR